ncbi:hypothetical protein BS78_09G253000 [Paspalum vaginatum]|nr:hypothetical protein BS78_09G253000 [Paspalum vaginatum]
MSSDGSEQFIARYDGFKVLKMLYAARSPYHGVPAKTLLHCRRARPTPTPEFPQYYSMYLVLPDGVVYDHQPTLPRVVGHVRVPKLKLSFTTSVKHALRQELGIETLFSPGAAALPDIRPRRRFTIPVGRLAQGGTRDGRGIPRLAGGAAGCTDDEARGGTSICPSSWKKSPVQSS